MSKEYIEREKLFKEIYDANWYHITTHGTLCIGAADEETALYKAQHIFDIVKNTSAADVEPVRHGRWKVINTINNGAAMELQCSACECKAIFGKVPIKFCPNCGAHMEDNGKIKAGGNSNDR